MLPIIVEKTEIDNQIFFALNTGQILTGFKLSILDREKLDQEIEHLSSKLNDFYSNLNQELTIKFYLKSEYENKPFEISRDEAVNQLGYIKNELYFFAFIKENSAKSLFKILTNVGKNIKTQSSFEPLAYKLKNLINIEALNDIFKTEALSQEGFENLLPEVNRDYIEKLPSSIDLGTKLRGYVRLNKLNSNQISMLTICNVKDAIPTPYNIVLNVKKMSQTKAENLLKIKTNQSEQSNTRVGAKQYQEAQEKMEQVQLQGSSLLEFEYIIEIERSAEKEIREDSNKIIQYFRSLGDFYYETFGAYPTFLSALPNGEIHHPIIETSSLMPCYTPVLSYGSNIGETLEENNNLKVSKSSLFLHREDYSPYFLDIYNPANENYSCAVVGLSGYGKSFFTNLLTRALYNDPDISIIKIDIGSSHSRETEMLGGAEYRLSLEKPSGINPFFILNDLKETNLDYNSLIATFIKTLITEKGELFLSKDMTADIENAVSRYALMCPNKASIDDFLEKIPDFPRRKLLERWGNNGNFRNAFKVSADTASLFDKRLKYYDLAEVLQAQDPDFATGALAAVMSQFNIEMMKINEYNKRNGTAKKLVFIADETPQFIKQNFGLFSFTVKNVRKFGGSLIPIVQKTEDLVIDGDTSILDNCASKVLFSLDGEKEKYAKRVKLEENSREMSVISSFKKNTNKSQFMFLDSQGARVLNVNATKIEYWSATSSPQDKAKIQKLMNAVPELSIEEAIRCLSN